MKDEGNENTENLDKDQIRYVVNILNVIVKYSRPIEGRRIRINMHEEKEAKRDNARDLVQFSQ